MTTAPHQRHICIISHRPSHCCFHVLHFLQPSLAAALNCCGSQHQRQTEGRRLDYLLFVPPSPPTASSIASTPSPAYPILYPIIFCLFLSSQLKCVYLLQPLVPSWQYPTYLRTGTGAHSLSVGSASCCPHPPRAQPITQTITLVKPSFYTKPKQTLYLYSQSSRRLCA
ncbi:hypothetical protein C8F01DRAFT_775716 [Mycena amicta]|nr:hypothetical protein C8F01DRAFT_775716 [Mycena amicta]